MNYYIYCTGEQARYKSIFYGVSNIFGLCYQALYQSTINSSGSEINIYLLGYTAGFGVNINYGCKDISSFNCNDNSSCILHTNKWNN